jgi:hypothetical protein
MLLTTQTLLTTTTYGVPSGDYDGSSLDFVSEPAIAADFYRGLGGIQTITIRVTNFVGDIRLQASLNNEWQKAFWFETAQFGDPLHAISGVQAITVKGNFVWMRAEILEFTSGTIDSITITY